jgi:hypothetical protein
MTSTDQLFDRVNGHPLGARVNQGHREVVVTKPSHFRGLRWLRSEHRRWTLGGVLLVAASLLLAGLAVTQGYVSWHQQLLFDLAAKPGQRTASALEAIGLDSAAVIFAILGIALARLGRPARIERVLVAACSLGSMLMNLLGADLASPRSVAVYVMPPVLFATGADRLIAVIRRSALGPDEDDDSQRSSWRVAGRAAMYGLRFVLAPPSTATGVRRMLLLATPLPALEAPAPPAEIEAPENVAVPIGRDPYDDSFDLWLAGGHLERWPHVATREEEDEVAGQDEDDRQHVPRDGTKTARFLALVSASHGDLAAFPLQDVARVAGELAAEVDLNEGSARRELRNAVLAAQGGGA